MSSGVECRNLNRPQWWVSDEFNPPLCCHGYSRSSLLSPPEDQESSEDTEDEEEDDEEEDEEEEDKEEAESKWNKF